MRQELSRKEHNKFNIKQISSDTWHKNPNPKENVGLRKQKQDNTDTYLTL